MGQRSGLVLLAWCADWVLGAPGWVADHDVHVALHDYQSGRQGVARWFGRGCTVRQRVRLIASMQCSVLTSVHRDLEDEYSEDTKDVACAMAKEASHISEKADKSHLRRRSVQL